MNLRVEILKEHSKRQAVKIAEYVGNTKNRFDELIDLFLNSEYRITQRAAWPVSLCAEAYPELIKPHLKKILQNLENPKLHDAVKRNTVRLLQNFPIPLNLQGLAADSCFRYLDSPDEPVAVKVFSMSVLANLCKQHPEMKEELKMLIEKQMPYSSAGFRSRGRKIVAQL